MTTTPFISEAQLRSMGFTVIQTDFILQELTAVYERGRADAVEYLKRRGEEAVKGFWYVTDEDFTSALTTEGK